jgi:outer membrane protein OmpA-like peptidoglycan-associated protein
VNPFARKKWVNRQLDPIHGQLNELSEVNAKNAQDIKDVDARAQAGISRAQSTADQAGATANAAGQQAAQAGTVAGQATGKVTSLTQTVNGLGQYTERKTLTITFRGGQPLLSAEARQQLDELATAIRGHQGYLLELSAWAPAAGSAGIQNSEKLAESVKRYLVTQHDIPVYRMHSVAMGNAQGADAERIRTSKVEVRLMENTLAASDESTPRFGSSRNGAERP